MAHDWTYEACEAAGLAYEASLRPCEACGQHYPDGELWECWACVTAHCGDCVDAHGFPCSHFREDD